LFTFSVNLNKNFEQAIEAVTAALKDEAFGVLTDIDFSGTIKAKLNIDHRPYRILGACNPPLANEAVTADPSVGALLPCNVVVREVEDDQCEVIFMDPLAVMKLTDNPTIAKVANDANDRLQRVKQVLTAG